MPSRETVYLAGGKAWTAIEVAWKKPGDRSCSCSFQVMSWPLPNDIPGRLVVTEPYVAGMAEFCIRRPFGENDLADQVGGDEVLSLLCPLFIGERGDLPFPGGEAFAKSSVSDHRSCPHPAGIHKPVALVISQKERPKTNPASQRVGVAADDEFLLVDALELEPVS